MTAPSEPLADTPPKNTGDGELPEFHDYALPLVRQITVRIPAPFYARLVCQTLTTKDSETAIIRRWLWRGALVEGIDLMKPL